MTEAKVENRARDLRASYREKVYAALNESILPFWQRAIDAEHGGVFSCWNNAGTVLVSRDKFVWSQGRFAWLWSRLAILARAGRLPEEAGAYLAQASKTVGLLQRHALLPDGRCAFLLSEDGAPKEAVPGAGLAPSIYADCFVAMGCAEYAQASGDRAALDAAWRLAADIERRISAGPVPTHPVPVPDGFVAHGVAMIWLNVTLVIFDACAALHDVRLAEARQRTVAAAAMIFDRFLQPDGRIAELRSIDGGEDDILLGRHFNPGHALECLWMLLTVAKREGRADWVARACRAVTFALEGGWDELHGGLFHFVDRELMAPEGKTGGTEYEAKVWASWDAKLWWVHSEALYATALAADISRDAGFRAWFEKLWDYTFRVFPQRDQSIGEWIQIRDRRGAPLERIVALPVKDPYHIARNLIQLLELFAEETRQVPEPRLGAALIGKEEEALVLDVLRRKALFRYYGPDPQSPPRMVATLEQEFAAMIGVRHALGVTSGTAALEVALGALGVGPGDEVIVPAWSWVSCFTAVVRVGGKPVLAEIDDTLCLAPGEITRLRTPRTKAALVVHFQGVAADLDALLGETRAAGIALLEDCAESPGASYRGRRVGAWGDIAIFSFQQQKTITSGEGGMVVTNDARLHERAVRMHDLGQYRPFHAAQSAAREPAFAGSQFRMSELTGAVALAQIRKLDAIRAHCRRLSLRLRARIGDLPGITLRRVPDGAGESGFETYFFVATAECRDVWRAKLAAAGIPCEQMTGTYAQYRRPYVATGLAHAPGATPFRASAGEVWPAAGFRAEDFPRTERLIHRFVVIPVGMAHTEEDMDYIADVIRRTDAEMNGA